MAKTCFVIMPFGNKNDVDGTIVEFDNIYEILIKPAAEAANLEVIRCDKIGTSGPIHNEMIEHIHRDDVAVVDITTLNANVFYELGVRQALRRSVTVIIRKKGSSIPFNIQGLHIIEYDLKSRESREKAQREIGECIRLGLANPKSDSRVFDVLKLKQGDDSSPLTNRETFKYVIKSKPPKQICITTGNIKDIRGIDVWVSSENTNMQMARFFDKSVSSMIRYLGAERDQAEIVVKDTIADELSEKMAPHKGAVPPGTIIFTKAGTLERTHHVKRIFHAASVIGEVGRGYTPIANVADCVWNALDKADQLGDVHVTSILFPLFGTGTAQGDLRSCVQPLLKAAIDYLSATENSSIQCVYFNAWTENQLTACLNVLDHCAGVERAKLKGPSKPKNGSRK